jgi:hypothetical protein
VADSSSVKRSRGLASTLVSARHRACQPVPLPSAPEQGNGVVLLDLTGLVLACSEQAAQMLGFENSLGLVGRERLFDPTRLAGGDLTLEVALADGRASRLRAQTQLLLKVDGSPYAILTRLRALG